MKMEAAIFPFCDLQTKKSKNAAFVNWKIIRWTRWLNVFGITVAGWE